MPKDNSIEKREGNKSEKHSSQESVLSLAEMEKNIEEAEEKLAALNKEIIALVEEIENNIRILKTVNKQHAQEVEENLARRERLLQSLVARAHEYKDYLTTESKMVEQLLLEVNHAAAHMFSSSPHKNLPLS